MPDKPLSIPEQIQYEVMNPETKEFNEALKSSITVKDDLERAMFYLERAMRYLSEQ